MTWKSFVCLAAFAAMAVPAVAQLPTIGLEDRGSGVGALTITTSQSGSLGVNLQVDFGDGVSLVSGTSALSMIGVDPTDPSIILDLDGLGINNNPFLNPDDTLGTTAGLEESGGVIFASVGLSSQGARTFDLLTFNFDGVGVISASGSVAQVGDRNLGLFASVAVPEPSAGVLAALGLAGLGFRRR